MSESSNTEVARVPEAEYWRGEDTQIKNPMNQHRNSLESLTENHSSQVQHETPEDWTKISFWGVGSGGQLQAKNSLQSSHKSRNHLSSRWPEWREFVAYTENLGGTPKGSWFTRGIN